MTDQEFTRQADAAIETLYNKLSDAAGDHDFDVDMNEGALAVEFEDPRERFVVSPNSPVRQIWVSAHSTSYKLDWNEAEGAFVLPASRETLNQVMAGAIARRLNEEFVL